MSAARIAQHEIQPLPRWARLALAARCLRRARGLARPAPAQAALLDTALARLEEAVTTGRAGEGLEEAAASAYTLALDNLDAPAPATPSQADLDVVTCMVAHATAFAAEAATLSDPRQAAHLVAQSIDFAIHAFRLAGASDAAAPLAAIRADLERLQTATASWTDEAPVPAGFFEPS
jgi:hypothetical protein